MAWFLHNWPMLFGIFGFFVVSALITFGISAQDSSISSSDDDAYGIAFAILIIIWWGYFFALAIATWLISLWLKSRALWLLLLAPITALWFVSKTVQITTSDSTIGDLVIGFLISTIVAALPIFLGAGPHIGRRILNFRHTKGAVD